MVQPPIVPADAFIEPLITALFADILPFVSKEKLEADIISF